MKLGDGHMKSCAKFGLQIHCQNKMIKEPEAHGLT